MRVDKLVHSICAHAMLFNVVATASKQQKHEQSMAQCCNTDISPSQACNGCHQSNNYRNIYDCCEIFQQHLPSRHSWCSMAKIEAVTPEKNRYICFRCADCAGLGQPTLRYVQLLVKAVLQAWMMCSDV
jgi:hypothetical protein